MGNNFLWDEDIDPNVEDDSIYSEDVREQLLDDDELSPSEVGFMKGYDEAYV
tara:strand:+ start:43 stop:198 length:156 start_codon:yes stop_codon:yes gene_type:complete